MSQNVQSDSIGHVFLSYVHEDTDEVDRLGAVLAAQGILVWRDRDNLWPGQSWKIEIRKADHSGQSRVRGVFLQQQCREGSVLPK